MSDLNLPYADLPEDDASKNTGDDFNSGIIRKTEYFDLFISYKRDNGGDHGQKLAEELYEKLTADGYKIWLDNQEIGYSSNFEQRIEEAIIHSKKFVAILGPAWVESPNCRYEFQKAVGFEKRIIPIYYQDFRTLLAEKKSDGILTEHEWTRIDKPQEVHFGDQTNFSKSYKALKALCDLKDEITTQHTRILCESYYWEKYNRPKSMLVFGSLLSRIRLLRAKCNGDDELPSFTATQNDFVDASQEFVSTEVSNKRKVFISFQPSEYAFAAELNTELRLNNISTYFDEGMVKGESDSSFIEHILNCENVLDVTSIGSSSEDDLRVAFARSNSKRVLQVTDSMEVLAEHKENGEKNIYFWNENVSIDKLITTINGDQVYNSAHANLLGLAFLWEKAEKNTNKLLPFKEAEAMKTWYQAAEKAGIEPQPNLAMINFVERSLTHADTVRKRRRLLVWSITVGIVILVALIFTSLYLKRNVDAALVQERNAKEEARKADSLAVIAKGKVELANIEAGKAEEALTQLEKDRENLIDANKKAQLEMERVFNAQKNELEKRADNDKKAMLENFESERILANNEFEAFEKENKRKTDELEKKSAEIETVINSKKSALEAYGYMQSGSREKAAISAEAAVLGLDEFDISTEVVALHQVYNWLLPDTSQLKRQFDNEDTLKMHLTYHTEDLSSHGRAIKKSNPIIGELFGGDSLLFSAGAYNDSAKMYSFGTVEGKIRIYGLDSDNNFVDTFSVSTNGHRINNVAISPDGRQLAFSCIDETLTLISLDENHQQEKYSEIITRPVIARIEKLYFLKNGILITVNSMGDHQAYGSKVSVLKKQYDSFDAIKEQSHE
jgi:biopolymer transport protein ExbD